MHEMALMNELVQLVEADARKRKIRQIDQIKLIVGDLSNTLPEALELAFRFARTQNREIIHERTNLQIVREMAKAKCQVCHHEFTPDYRIAFCPICNLPNCILIAGETLRIESYEGIEDHED